MRNHRREVKPKGKSNDAGEKMNPKPVGDLPPMLLTVSITERFIKKTVENWKSRKVTAAIYRSILEAVPV